MHPKHKTKLISILGWNSSWTKDVGPFPSLWRVLEEMLNRDRLMTLKAQKDAGKVKNKLNTNYETINLTITKSAT